MASPGKKSGRVLIVEDEEINRVFIEENIKRSNRELEVVSVASAPEGLYHFFTSKFDLIFLDIMMPVIDGNDFLDIVEKNIECKNVDSHQNIVVQTAIRSLEQLTNYTKKDYVQEVLRKPINGERIKECLFRYVKK